MLENLKCCARLRRDGTCGPPGISHQLLAELNVAVAATGIHSDGVDAIGMQYDQRDGLALILTCVAGLVTEVNR